MRSERLFVSSDKGKLGPPSRSLVSFDSILSRTGSSPPHCAVVSRSWLQEARYGETYEPPDQLPLRFCEMSARPGAPINSRTVGQVDRIGYERYGASTHNSGVDVFPKRELDLLARQEVHARARIASPLLPDSCHFHCILVKSDHAAAVINTQRFDPPGDTVVSPLSMMNDRPV